MKILDHLHKIHHKNEPDKQREALGKTYAELLGRLSEIRANYEFVSEKSVIDALIYEENAVLSKLEALFSDAKKRGLNLEFYEFANEQKKF